MECDPTLSEDVGQLAWPLLRVRLLQLVMAVPPSLKVTFPAGLPEPGLLAVTVAVKVTDCPDSDGLAEELTPVVVPGSVVVVVGFVEVVVEVVVTEPGLVVVVGPAPAGLKVASTMYQLVDKPKVRPPCWGPAALDRMSTRSEASLPLCTSRRYGTIWLLPGISHLGWPPVRTAATTNSPAGTEAVGPALAQFPVPCETTAWS